MKLELAKVGPGEAASAFPGDQFPTGKLAIRYKGAFDWTHVYRTMQRWFEQRRFRFYESRIKDTGKRIKDDVYATREIDEFFMEKYNVKVEMWHLTQSEIMVHGQPRKILTGMVQFTIWGAIIPDYAGFYKGSKLKEWLGNIMMNVRWREIEMQYIDTMEYRCQDIQTMIKEALGMITQENAPW